MASRLGAVFSSLKAGIGAGKKQRFEPSGEDSRDKPPVGASSATAVDADPELGWPRPLSVDHHRATVASTAVGSNGMNENAHFRGSHASFGTESALTRAGDNADADSIAAEKAAAAAAGTLDPPSKATKWELTPRRKMLMKRGAIVAGAIGLVLMVLLLVWLNMKVTVDFISLRSLPSPRPAGAANLVSGAKQQVRLMTAFTAANVESLNGPLEAQIAIMGPGGSNSVAYDINIEVKTQGRQLFTVSVPNDVPLLPGLATPVNATGQATNMDLFTELCGTSMLTRRLNVQISGTARMRGWRGMFNGVGLRSVLGNIPCFTVQ